MSHRGSAQPSFTERQRFTHWWLWLLLLSVNALLWYALYQQVVRGLPVGDRPATDGELWLLSGLVMLLTVGFALLQLRTQLTAHSIHVALFPFYRRQFSWSEIGQAEVVDYGFLGGWGIQWHSRYGRVLNVKGRQGLALTFRDGRKWLIGTQQPETLRAWLVHSDVPARNKQA